MKQIQQQLEAYALGLLGKEESEGVEDALREDPKLCEALVDVNETLTFAAAAAPPMLPNEGLRARLLQSTDPSRRFSGFQDRLTTFLDLPLSAVEAILALARTVPNVAPWKPATVPGQFRAKIAAGPARGSCEARLLHLEPGTVFPAHRHLGTEWGFILQGSVSDSEDGHQAAGDIVMKRPDSQHSVKVTSDEPAIFVVLLEDGGIEFA